jgi:hypothetical protein
VEASKDSLFVFADGTVIPVLHQQHGECESHGARKEYRPRVRRVDFCCASRSRISWWRGSRTSAVLGWLCTRIRMPPLGISPLHNVSFSGIRRR